MSDIPSEITNDILIHLPDKFMLSNLPSEILENILSRLPVKTLKRFRAVEKSWCYLIDSGRFAKMHLHRSFISSSLLNLISGFLGFYWMGLDSLDQAQAIKPEFVYDHKFCHPISNSCNGLVVVMREPEPPVLWNPFSREYKFLPKCPLDFSADSSFSCKTTYGFGYDSRNDDYKVVKVMSFEKLSSWMLSEEWIYSLKSNCWRRTKGTYYDRGHWPTHVNGALHALIRTGLDHSTSKIKIMGFSVESEKDYEVMMPEIDRKDLIHVSLELFDGCLALVCSYTFGVVIWVMEEYGVKVSWTALLSFPREPHGFVCPLVYSKERDKILLNCSGQTLIFYGLRTTSVENFTMPFGFSPGLCVETLISPNEWDKRSTGEKSSAEEHHKNGKEMMMMMMMKKKKKKERDAFLSAGFKLLL
ncbi:hypothetical protein OROMI_014602 [Orobanche minor]